MSTINALGYVRVVTNVGIVIEILQVSRSFAEIQAISGFCQVDSRHIGLHRINLSMSICNVTNNFPGSGLLENMGKSLEFGWYIFHNCPYN